MLCPCPPCAQTPPTGRGSRRQDRFGITLGLTPLASNQWRPVWCWCIPGMRVTGTDGQSHQRASKGHVIVGSNGTAAPGTPGGLGAGKHPVHCRCPCGNVSTDTKPNTPKVGEAPRHAERSHSWQCVSRRGGHRPGRAAKPLPNPSRCRSYGREHPPSKVTQGRNPAFPT